MGRGVWRVLGAESGPCPARASLCPGLNQGVCRGPSPPFPALGLVGVSTGTLDSESVRPPPAACTCRGHSPPPTSVVGRHWPFRWPLGQSADVTANHGRLRGRGARRCSRPHLALGLWPPKALLSGRGPTVTPGAQPCRKPPIPAAQPSQKPRVWTRRWGVAWGLGSDP